MARRRYNNKPFTLAIDTFVFDIKIYILFSIFTFLFY